MEEFCWEFDGCGGEREEEEGEEEEEKEERERRRQGHGSVSRGEEWSGKVLYDINYFFLSSSKIEVKNNDNIKLWGVRGERGKIL